MGGILERIVGATRGRVAESRRVADLRELERRAELHVPRGFRLALESKSREGVAVIAEVKKASPSKGLIRAEFHPAELPRELEPAGAAGLSAFPGRALLSGRCGRCAQAAAAPGRSPPPA